MKRLTTTLAVILAVAACSWALLDVPGSPPANTTPDPTTQRAVTALVHDSVPAALDAVPARFAAVRGYQPVVDDRLLVDPSGACSSPVPLPASFLPVCRRHDLGYDLIRYADAIGHPLPPSARRAVDDQFATGLVDACPARGGLGCRAWAGAAITAVRVNSWRQHWQAPWQETPATIAQGASGIAGALALLGLLGAGCVASCRRGARALDGWLAQRPVGTTAVAS